MNKNVRSVDVDSLFKSKPVTEKANDGLTKQQKKKIKRKMKKQQQANADPQTKKSEESDHSKENQIRAVSESTDDEIEMPRSHSLPNLTCAP